MGGGGRLAGESSAEGPGSKVHFQGHQPPQILRTVPRGVSAEKGQVVPGRARVLPGPDVGTRWRTEQGRVTFPVSPLSPRRGRGVCSPRLASGDGRPPQTVAATSMRLLQRTSLKGPRLEINSLKLKSITISNINTDYPFFIALCSGDALFLRLSRGGSTVPRGQLSRGT